MWLFTTDGFLSIVSKGCRRDQLMVRSRVRADIKRAFPKAKIVTTPPPADYRYRAIVSRKEIAAYLAEMVATLDYANFKDTVRDDQRHVAYLRVWNAMFAYQGRSEVPRAKRRGRMVTDPPKLRLNLSNACGEDTFIDVDLPPARGLFDEVYDDAGIWHPNKRRTKK